MADKKIEIIIDNRETKIKNYFTNLNNSYLNLDIIKFTNLDVGDIIITNNCFQYIFERKTLNDLSQSIKDKRYKEQKIRLNSLNNCKILYIIENFDNYKNLQYVKNGLNSNVLTTLILNKTLLENHGILLTKDIDETIYVLEKIINKMLDKPDKYFINNNSDKTIVKTNLNDIDSLNTVLINKKRNENITKDNIMILMLSQIPGVSTKIAKCIFNEYKTMNNLYSILNNNTKFENIEILKELKIQSSSGDKFRKLGKKTSEKIIEYLF